MKKKAAWPPGPEFSGADPNATYTFEFDIVIQIPEDTVPDITQSIEQQSIIFEHPGIQDQIQSAVDEIKNILGPEAQDRLEKAGITINKNSIPYDPNPPFKPSGIRLGTPAITTRGMKEKEMKKIASWINEVILDEKSCLKVRKEIKNLCKRFPLP